MAALTVPSKQQNAPKKGCRSTDTSSIPSFPMDSPAGHEFVAWLTSAAGGGKNARQAHQTARRCLKFLRSSYEEEETTLTEDIIDFCLGSPTILCKFVTTMEEQWKLSYAGQMGYLTAISELIDYRRIKLPSRKVVENVSVTEIYLKRAKKCIGKMMKVQWTNDMDIETLEAKGNWASMEEMLEVIPYHLPRYKSILERCKTNGTVTAHDLSFANKFIANYLFINVKGSRPMTYKYLTVDMIESAKLNGGFVDQREFKTAATYGFDSFVLDNTSLRILEDFVKHIRPRFSPKCNYLLVTRNGTQYDKLCDMMSKLVFDAIGKYIHPTRLRQIIETESDKCLPAEDRQAITEDQKHSSSVAKIYYKKKRSREVASKARDSLQKLETNKRSRVECKLRSVLQLSDDDTDQLSRSETEMESCTIKPLLQTSESERENGDKFAELPKVGVSPNKPKRVTTQVKAVIETLRNNDQPMRFTTHEDMMLKEGIEKYGFGKWTAILRDAGLQFLDGRTADALKKRAMSKTFMKMTEATTCDDATSF